jgi:hypothetical protein
MEKNWIDGLGLNIRMLKPNEQEIIRKAYTSFKDFLGSVRTLLIGDLMDHLGMEDDILNIAKNVGHLTCL